MRFCQVNLKKKAAASHELEAYMIDNKIDVALIQEPGMEEKSVVEFGELQLLYQKIPNSTKTQRSCIVCQKNTKIFMLNQFCNEDITTALLSFNENGRVNKIVICSAYFPGEENQCPSDPIIMQLVEYGKKNSLQILICADSNAKNTAFGSKKTDERGKLLYQFISNNNLAVANNGTKPTFECSTGSSVIDFTITSAFLVNKITDWTVHDDAIKTDHKLITFSIQGLRKFRITYRNIKQCNWQIYKEFVEREIKLNFSNFQINNTSDLEDKVNTFNEILVHAFHAGCKEKVSRSNIVNKWWNEKLRLMKQEVRKLRNIWKEHKTPANRINYRKASNLYCYLIRKAKKSSWKKFCEDVSTTSQTARLFKLMEDGKKTNLGTIKLPDGSHTINEEETIMKFNSIHFPNSTRVNEDDDKNDQPTKLSNRKLKRLKKVISKAAIEKAIKQSKPYKACGEDGIYPIMLQKVQPIISPILQILFLKSFQLKHIPKMWRIVKVIYIPKPGKSSYEDPKSFRPISLMSTILKTFERLIYNHITSQFGPSTIHEHQFAYLSNKSVDHATNKLTNLIEKTLKDKEYGIGAFVDISNAFSGATYESIKEAADKHGINTDITEWIINMLKKRIMSTTINSTIVNVTPQQGCNQGSILSPLLWILIADKMIRDLNKAGITCIGYADDFLIYISSICESTAASKIIQALKKLKKCCEEVKLSFNAEKTEIIKFTHRMVKKPSLTFNNKVINFSKSVKYLGVTFDSRLNWNKQLEMIEDKNRKLLMAALRICQKNFGVKPRIMKWIYEHILLPRLTYGAFNWWPKLENQDTRNKLWSMQRLPLMCMTAANKSTPTVALWAATNTRPLDTEMMKAAMKTAIRIEAHKDKDIYQNGHTIYFEKLKHILNMSHSDEMNFDYTQKQEISKEFTLIFDENEKFTSTRNRIDFFTDGSGLDGKSGIGVFSPDLDIVLGDRTVDSADINKTELTALIIACETALERNIRNSDIVLNTDSMNSLHKLNRSHSNSRQLNTLLETINKLAQFNNNRIVIRWVKAHADNFGNEIADKLAKAGTTKDSDATHQRFDMLSGREIDLGIKKWQENQLRRLWMSQVKDESTTKKFMDIERLIKNNGWNHFSRTNMRILINLLSGHNCLQRNQYIKKICSSDECRLCLEEEETSEHILCSCLAINELRRKYFGRAQSTAQDIKEHSPFTILKFVDEANVAELLFKNKSSICWT